MKKSCFILVAVTFLALLNGCANQELIADVDPATNLSALNTFYVVRLPTDERGVEQLIAAELNTMGKTATSGVSPTPPASVDAVVTYEDSWMWDITMYMIELTVYLQDPETEYKFATGRSYRTSLVRKTPEEMVKEVLGKIFEKQTAGESQ
jgi:hypothetical protein